MQKPNPTEQLGALIQEVKLIDILEARNKLLLSTRKELILKNGTLQNLLKRNIRDLELIEAKTARIVFTLSIEKLKGQYDLLKEYYLELILEKQNNEQAIKLIDFETEVISNKIGDSKQSKLLLLEKLAKLEANVISGKLAAFKALNTNYIKLVKLQKEMHEARAEGKAIIKKFKVAIKFLYSVSAELIHQQYDKRQIENYLVKNVDNYQSMVLEIQHAFFKYDLEIHDVLHQLLNMQERPNYKFKNFMKNYRINLINDITRAKNLQRSFEFLNTYLDLVENMNRILQEDLSKTRKQIKVIQTNPLFNLNPK